MRRSRRAGCSDLEQQQPSEFIAASPSEEALLRIVGPNFSVVLRLRGGVVAGPRVR
jgi:hypothetical protein